MQDEAFRGQKREGCGLRKGSLAVAHPRGDLLQRYKYLFSTPSNPFPPSNMSFFYRHGRCPLLKVGIPNHPLLRLAKPKSLHSHLTHRQFSRHVVILCHLKEASPWNELQRLFCLSFFICRALMSYPLHWLPSQGKWMPLAEDMAVAFTIATTGNSMGRLTQRGTEGSHSRGSVEKWTEQDKGNWIAD